MIYVASRRGVYPKGLHWSPGEMRDVSYQAAFDPDKCPDWLTLVPAEKPKPSKKAAKAKDEPAPKEG